MLPLNLSMLKSKHSDRSLEGLEILTFFFFDLLKFMPNPQVLVMIRKFPFACNLHATTENKKPLNSFKIKGLVL